MALRLRVRCTEVRAFEVLNERTGEPQEAPQASWEAVFAPALRSYQTPPFVGREFSVIGTSEFEVGREYNIEITRAKDAKR